jgi:hypothetical protein
MDNKSLSAYEISLETTSAYTSKDNTNATFTFEKLQDVIDLLYPILYYGTDSNKERGSFYLCKETMWNPEFIICNPDDLDVLKEEFKSIRRLVHLKDESSESVWNRIRNNYKFDFEKPIEDNDFKFRYDNSWLRKDGNYGYWKD